MKKSPLRRLAVEMLSLPKTLRFNIRTFGLRGLRMPVLVHYRVRVSTFRGAVELRVPMRRATVTFGFGGSQGVVTNGRAEICFEKGSKTVFCGRAQFAEGCSVRNEGLLEFGGNFSANKNCFISCHEAVSFGGEITLGWNINIRDSDGHYIIRGGERGKVSEPVRIGSHVWVCSFCDILKGVTIGNDSVVAYRSLVTKAFPQEHVMLGGAPAKIIGENIDWEV